MKFLCMYINNQWERDFEQASTLDILFSVYRNGKLLQATAKMYRENISLTVFCQL